MAAILKRSKIEYLSYSVNWIQGCSVACHYCYMAALSKRFGLDWGSPRKVVSNPAQQLSSELDSMRSLPEGPIMISTSHDPAMNQEVGADLREIVSVLASFGIADRSLILSKRPMHALAALSGIGAGTGLRIGTSLTALDQELTQVYEPGSESPQVRIAAIQKAATDGYRTWISIEPPLPGAPLYHIIEGINLDALGWPWVVLGKLNGRHSDKRLSEWARTHDWGVDHCRARNLLAEQYYRHSPTPADSSFYVKAELAKDYIWFR